MQGSSYPVTLRATAPEVLSRWLWLVKWLLLVPHFLVLILLSIASVLLTVYAFFAILFTDVYPRSVFNFNVGVLRWTWRVVFYGYSALATDRYPPFTLERRDDYPADLEVAYPEHLSRGLVLVKWWLLALPHYLVVTVLQGGFPSWGNAGLLNILALFAGVGLLFKGKYPHGLFELLLGFNRWVFRVAAYAALMRDEYPPFRLGE